MTVLPTVYFVSLGMQVCFIYVRLVGGSTNLLGLTSPDIDLVGLRIIMLVTLVIIQLSLMNSFDLLIVQSNVQVFEGSPGRELSRW